MKRESPRFTKTEFRVSEDGKKLQGYAAIFNQETVIGNWFREVVRPGAFTQALQEQADVRALFNHSENFVLGRTSAGTLRLWEDAQGLGYEVDLPDTSLAKDLAVSIKRGDVDQSSFAFSVLKDGEDWDEDEKGKLPLRTLKRLWLYDVSPVTFPAYEDTSVSVRSFEEVKISGENILSARSTRSLSEFEKRLRVRELSLRF